MILQGGGTAKRVKKERPGVHTPGPVVHRWSPQNPVLSPSVTTRPVGLVFRPVTAASWSRSIYTRAAGFSHPCRPFESTWAKRSRRQQGLLKHTSIHDWQRTVAASSRLLSDYRIDLGAGRSLISTIAREWVAVNRFSGAEAVPEELAGLRVIHAEFDCLVR